MIVFTKVYVSKSKTNYRSYQKYQFSHNTRNLRKKPVHVQLVPTTLRDNNVTVTLCIVFI